MKKIYTVIDLFSGAGGLTEGFLQTDKFDFLAHVEWEIPMVQTLRNNLIKRWNYNEEKAKKSVIRFDIQKTDELFNGSWTEETKKDYEKDNSEVIVKNGIDYLVKDKEVDVIIGGPPCQAYSLAGRAQDPNSMKEDYRNYLFESFVKVVDHYKPKVFVFENVPGMLSAKPGDKLVIDRIYEAFYNIGYTIRKPQELKNAIFSSADYQVPQDRHRVIIFGVRNDYNKSVEDFYNALIKLKSNEPIKTVRDAIGSMPKFKPLNNSYKKGNTNISHKLIGNEKILDHEARYHNKRDIAVFKEWLTKKMNNYDNQEKLEFYKKVTGKESNHNKYRNLEWDKPSPTIVSHLYKDGLMFIHPDEKQLRSITVREAALLQTFPMDFEFIGSNAYKYKMIGNAVPVLFAKNIAQAIINVFEDKK
ncbi:MAG: DNA cytosine methyltransferase [Clostridia bacterium]|nr:DNA cytosine methyltransferase [Clostridia bacterium]